MNIPVSILFKSLVRPFYKENLPILFFLFIVLFGIVAEVDGAEIFQFHYSLVIGLLQNSSYTVLVFIAWFLYIRKSAVFIRGRLKDPSYAFLSLYNQLSSQKRFRLFLLIETGLLLPVLLYVLIIVVIGCKLHLYWSVFLVLAYLLVSIVVMAIWHVGVLADPYKGRSFRISWPPRLASSYAVILLRYVAGRQRIIWLGITVFTCGTLYGIAKNNTSGDYDRVFPYLFFNFGILASGIILHGIREFEETYLSFYRGVGVGLWKRLVGYAGVLFVLLFPEFVTIGLLAPVHLHIGDAVLFAGCGYGLLLLLFNITFLQHFGRREYLVLLLLIFGVQYFFMACFGLSLLCIALFGTATAAFLYGYYRYQRTIAPV